MRNTRAIASLLLFSGVLALVAVVGFSQAIHSPEEPMPKLDHIAAPAVVADAPRNPEHVVKLSQPGDERQKTIASLLQRQPESAQRAAYFKWAVDSLNVPVANLKGWHFEVRDVKVVEGATRVNVVATPLVTSAGGLPAFLSLALDETYELEGDNLRLLKSEVPPAQKGLGFLTY